MDLRNRNRQASKLRTNIKASVAQLDDWSSSQRNLRRRRKEAIAFSGGRRQYLDEARSRACASQGTTSLQDPPCTICGSSIHLSDECEFIAVLSNAEDSFEDPSAGIHRGIIHRLYTHSAELYKLLYPNFFPGSLRSEPSPPEALAIQSLPSLPDYQEIGISRAVALLTTLSSTLELNSFPQERALVDQIAQPFHSAAFPLDYSDFRDQIHQNWKRSSLPRNR